MKKLLSTAAMLILSQSVAGEGYSPQVEFILNSAHSKGFKDCDQAIAKAFQHAGGERIRVETGRFRELKHDSLRMTASWGFKGDSVLVTANFRKQGPTCFATTTTILTFEKSCTAYLLEMSEFKYVTEVADIIWTENPGKVTMILKPVGGSCLAVFDSDLKL